MHRCVDANVARNQLNIRVSEDREQILRHLKDATDENTNARALFIAARYYIEMRGNTVARPNGRVSELLNHVDEHPHVTVDDVQRILSTEQLSIDYEQHSWYLGP